MRVLYFISKTVTFVIRCESFMLEMVLINSNDQKSRDFVLNYNIRKKS